MGQPPYRVTFNPWRESMDPATNPDDLRLAATRLKVRAHRQRLRSQGLRPIQIWVPDVRSPQFTTEARHQSLLANAGPLEAEDQAFVDAISLWPDQAQE